MKLSNLSFRLISKTTEIAIKAVKVKTQENVRKSVNLGILASLNGSDEFLRLVDPI